MSPISIKKLKHFAQTLIASFHRFPLALVFITCFAISRLIKVHAPQVLSEDISFFCIFYFSTGTVLALALRIWSERHRGPLNIILQVLAHLLWIGLACYMTLERSQTQGEFAIVASAVFIIAVFLLLPFLQDKDDMRLWQFSVQTFLNVATAIALGLVLTGGIALLLKAFKELFSIQVSGNVYDDVFIICLTFFAPILFVQRLASSVTSDKDTTTTYTSFGTNVLHYLLFPLLSAYLLTLYAYAIKIIVAGELPTGWVSWLVSASMAVMLLYIFLLYPKYFAKANKFDRLCLRYLPLVLLPLLLLMSLGTYRRINDYGVTIWRLYLVFFNLWCYAVCIVWALTRCRRLRGVLASFPLLFFLASVGPWSMGSLTKYKLHEELKTSFHRAGFDKLPLNTQHTTAWVAALNEKETDKWSSKLSYLFKNYKPAYSVYSLIDSTAYKKVISPLFTERKLQKDEEEACSAGDKEGKGMILLPKGFRWAEYIESNIDLNNINRQGDALTFPVEYIQENKSHTAYFNMSVRYLLSQKQSATPYLFILKSNEATFYVSYFYYSWSKKERTGNLFLCGLLFSKATD